MNPVSDDDATMNQESISQLPDIASEPHGELAGRLDWVGMNHIEIPVRIPTGQGSVMQVPARVSAFVDLQQPDARGIHMSRLYLTLDRALAEHVLTPMALRHLLRDFLETHQGLSSRAMVRLDFEYQTRRRALASDNSGWRSYPFSVIAKLEGKRFTLELSYAVTYSSTCPCSAALARQLIQQQFEKDFDDGETVTRAAVLSWLGTEEGIMATPHSQRSTVDVRLKLVPTFEALPFDDVIDLVEDALKTPVQTAVKREDEQEFARLNGQNLMFCEDAGRRVRKALESEEQIVDFWARCSHFESLHPHDAVSIITKGVENGFQPIDSHR